MIRSWFFWNSFEFPHWLSLLFSFQRPWIFHRPLGPDLHHSISNSRCQWLICFVWLKSSEALTPLLFTHCASLRHFVRIPLLARVVYCYFYPSLPLELLIRQNPHLPNWFSTWYVLIYYIRNRAYLILSVIQKAFQTLPCYRNLYMINLPSLFAMSPITERTVPRKSTAT